jgi:hypothetical protein
LLAHAAKKPLMVVRRIDTGNLGVRFESIGDRQRFHRLLKRFRDEFVLARYAEIAGKSHWFISSSQSPDLLEFARRNGLTIQGDDDMPDVPGSY